MITKCKPIAEDMNEEPNPRQAPLVGFTKERVNEAEDHARYALKFLEEIVYHRITPEEVIRNAAIGIAEVNKAIEELKKAKLAGMPKIDTEEK